MYLKKKRFYRDCAGSNLARDSAWTQRDLNVARGGLFQETLEYHLRSSEPHIFLISTTGAIVSSVSSISIWMQLDNVSSWASTAPLMLPHLGRG